MGSSITLSATPSGGSWSGNDATVATVTSSGVVTGVASGTVSATYTDAYGGTSSVSIGTCVAGVLYDCSDVGL